MESFFRLFALFWFVLDCVGLQFDIFTLICVVLSVLVVIGIRGVKEVIERVEAREMTERDEMSGVLMVERRWVSWRVVGMVRMVERDRLAMILNNFICDTVLLWVDEMKVWMWWWMWEWIYFIMIWYCMIWYLSV